MGKAKRRTPQQWYYHVKRLKEYKLPTTAPEGKLVDNRLSGRPPKRWRDSWKSTSQESETTISYRSFNAKLSGSQNLDITFCSPGIYTGWL